MQSRSLWNDVKITAAALLVLLETGLGVQAAETAVLTFSCNGTVTDMKVSSDGKPEAIANTGLIVNLADRVVTGFGDISARITKIDANWVSFSGAKDNWNILGDIDRITGAVTAILTSRNAKTEQLMSSWHYDLLCKPTKRVF